ncbi:hypothetical protein [Streptomyces sp. NPDC057429]|uniref:hypothetical protein n=1 Tax=Streptomyces sp. NPDC057429 TaxID=3346130 RepID=UPI0036CF7EA9
MTVRHFTAWLVNAPSALDQAHMDVTVLEDKLIGGDSDDDGSWGTNSSKPTAFYAITTVDAREGDAKDGCDQAEELMGDAGWHVVGTWEAVDNAYIVTVHRDEN